MVSNARHQVLPQHDENTPLVDSPVMGGRSHLDMAEDPAVLRAARRSIYSVETVAEVAEKQGIEAVEKLTSGPRALFVMFLIFMMASLVGSMHPIIYSWALAHPITGDKKDTKFIPYVQYIMYYSLSTIVGNCLALAVHGKKGVKDCWYWKNLLLCIPASGTLAFVESLDAFAMARVPPALKNVLTQGKLPIITCISVLFLGRKQSRLQWTLVGAVTLSVMGYSTYQYQQSGANQVAKAVVAGITTTSTAAPATTTLGSNMLSTVAKVAAAGDAQKATVLIGILLCLMQCTCSSIGTTIAEFTYKHMHFPFFIQMAQTRFVSMLISFVYLAVFKATHPDMPFFSGYDVNSKMWLLLPWLVVRDWSQTLCVKRLSALWKSLASGVSMCITYFISVSRGIEVFNAVKVFMIFALVMDILAYAFSRRETKLKEAAAKKQASLDQIVADAKV